MEEILFDNTVGDSLIDIVKDEEKMKRLEALIEKSKRTSSRSNECPGIINIYPGQGSKKEKEYYKYATNILTNLIAKEFNDENNKEAVKDLTEMKMSMLINKDGTLENLILSEAYPYAVLRNSGDYVDVQNIFDKIEYKFKETQIVSGCGKYKLHMTAEWNS